MLTLNGAEKLQLLNTSIHNSLWAESGRFRCPNAEDNILFCESYLKLDKLQPPVLFTRETCCMVPWSVKKIEKKGKHYSVYLKHTWTRQEMQNLTGKKFWLPSTWCNVSTEKEPTPSSFLTYSFEDVASGSQGKVIKEALAQPNPLVWIQIGNKTLPLPLHADFVIEIDRRKQSIRTRLPENYLEVFLQ